MPNMTHRHKRKNQRSAAGHNGTRSVGDLLNRRHIPVLSRITGQSARQAFWRDWLAVHLPAGLAGRITGIVEREGTLTVFAESAAWSARLRYAMEELGAAVREADPHIERVVVKVMPGTSTAAP